jgi:S1-C subfamily serine protease
VDLDNNDRQNFHRNTGAIVYVVIKNSPAFYANIVKNDIIVRINDHIINNTDDYYNLLDGVIDVDEEFEIEFIRNNQINIVKIKMY